MHAFFHAVDVFFAHLAAVRWGPLGIGVGCHLVKILLRTRAWRNILAAAYPETRVPQLSVLGAYVAGVGVNAIVPARGGDVLKLYLVKRRVEGATYPTLGATLLAETLFDAVVATALLLWAIHLGALPGLDVLPDLPSLDWSWPLRHERLTEIVGAVLGAVLVVLGVWATRRVLEFWRRVAQGLTILRDRGRFLRGVVAWQAVSWVFRLAAVFFFLRAFGLPATVHNALLVQVTQSLSTVLPLSPGGAGTEQGLLVYVFSGKASTTAVLSFSVGMHIALVVVNVLLGFAAIALMLRTLRWRRTLEARGEVAP